MARLGITMRVHALIMALIFCPLVANDFVMPAKKKKVPKVTAEDCLQRMLEGQQIAARQLQYLGQIQGIQIATGQDFFDGTGKLKNAKQEKLQEYKAQQEKINKLALEFEDALKEHRDYLKQF
ncbi:hypothetical protein BH09DEP1_BH09DEP1_5090 [soil metagenome]